MKYKKDNPKKTKKEKKEIKEVKEIKGNNRFLNFFKTKKGKITIILSSITLCALIVSIIVWNIMFVKVTFDTNGGDKMKSIYIRKNSVLDEKYKANKIGHIFIDWQYNGGKPILSNDGKIKDDITLIAEYNEIPEAGYIDTSLKNVEKDAKIVVKSLVELKNDNIDKYFSVKDGIDNLMKLNVKSLEDNKYEITTKEGWPEGFSYHAEILSLENIEFVSIGKQEVTKNTKSVFFDVYKENITEVDYTEDTKTAAKSDILSIKEKSTVKVNDADVKTYTATVKNSENYKAGDVILFGADTKDGNDDSYYVVMGNTADGLELRQATFKDVYDEVEFYYKDQIDFSQGGINYEQVANTIKDDLYNNQEGLVVLTNMYIEGAYNTEAVLNTLDNPSEKELNKMVNASKLTTIAKDKINVVIAPFTDEVGHIGLKLVIEVNGVSLDLGTKGNINISFKVEEIFIVDLLVVHKTEKLFGDWFNYTGLDLVNKFSMSFTVKLQTKDGESIDLAGDVEEFLSDAVANGKNKYDWVDEINNKHVMENTFDYIPIIEKEIFSKTFWIGLVTVDIKLEGVLSIGAEAAISAQYSIESYYQVGSANGYYTNGGEDFVIYEDGKTVSWNRKGVWSSSFDLTIKGAVGVRGGVRVSTSVSALGMNDLYSVGLSLEGGVYLELTGFVDLSIKTQQSRPTTATINGGVNFETGIYIEVDFVWNCWPFGMDSKDDVNLAEVQIPLYEFSTLNQPLGFDNASDNSENNPIKVYTNEYNIFTDGEQVGMMAFTQYNPKTKKYESALAEPTSFNIQYKCIEHWDDKTKSTYCNPNPNINEYVSVNKTNINKRGIIYISPEAPDGYKFFYNISGATINPITGEKTDHFEKNVWFQYEKCLDEDCVYDITFEVPEESGFPSYDKSQKKLSFTVPHGQELTFEQIPESYKKDGKMYIFDKWDKGFTGKQIMSEGDITYKAVFKEEPAKYTYTFHAMEGKFKNGSDTLEFKDIYHGQKFGTVDTPTRANYNFVGWTTGDIENGPNVTIEDGILYDLNGKEVYGDLTIYAIWKEIPNPSVFTLTFDAGDGYVLKGDTGSFVHSISVKAKKNEKFYEIPIAIKEDTTDPAYYYTDETFGLKEGFIPTESKTYTANYKRVQRQFDLFISDSTFIKKDGKITYSDDIVANTTDDKWKSGTFNQKLSIPSASIEIDGKTYTTNKYILIAENKNQKPYSITSTALNSKYGWSYNTAKVSMYGNSTTSIIYDPASKINYGTIISYYYGSNGFNLKGVSYIEFTAVPYFEI